MGDSSAGGANINTGGKSFGLFANPQLVPAPTSSARRRFAKPTMTTGDRVSFRISVNYRNGSKGFTLRNAAGTSQWNFTVGRVDGVNGGYYVRNGPSSVPFDDGQGFGPYNANTVFTFDFEQEGGQLLWTATREGGISAVQSGSAPIASGTVADINFFITGTEGAATEFDRAANNLYFNNFVFTPAALAAAPLTPGERRLPGRIPSYTLRYQHPTSLNTVTVRHSGDGFSNSTSMTMVDGVWELDIRSLGLSPGWHEFKFRPNSEWETGANRTLYLDEAGRISKPPALYLTWKTDPSTTIVVHWHNYDISQSSISWRRSGSDEEWTSSVAVSDEFPFTERWIHTASISGLAPDTEYEFAVAGYSGVFRFKTMPDQLSRPIKFGVGGDVDIGPTADAMTAAISSHSPDFLVVGGDLAYADGRAVNFVRWYRYLESWYRNARTPDGRLIPKIVAVGNHEVFSGLVQNHPDFEPTSDWRERYAPYFYTLFAFPGQPGYNVLDFGEYMSLVILDTDHTNQIASQSSWLESVLNARRGRPHVFPIYHTPGYTSHRSFNDPQAIGVRQHWHPVFEQAGVKLAFEHHDHTFKITKPLLSGVENSDGIVYVGDGLWGIGSRPVDFSRSYLSMASSDYHVHLVTISQSGRTLQTVGLNGSLFASPTGGTVLLSQTTDEAPEEVAASISGMTSNSLSLRWNPSPRATSYQVIRSDGQIFVATEPEFTDFSWTPISPYTYEVVAGNRTGPGPSSDSVQPSHRQTWATLNGLPWDGTGAGSFSSDPDGDGMNNLAEYFHGTDPVAPTSRNAWQSLPGESGPAAKFRRNRSAQDVSATVLWSTSLSPSAEWSSEGVSINFLGPDQQNSNVDWYGVTIEHSPIPPRAFLRLRVEDTSQ